MGAMDTQTRWPPTHTHTANAHRTRKFPPLHDQTNQTNTATPSPWPPPEAAVEAGVGRSVIARLRAVARDGAVATLGASKPG